MRNHFRDFSTRAREDWIAGFGGARVVKRCGGRLELRGGSDADKAQAHAWLRALLNLRRLR